MALLKSINQSCHQRDWGGGGTGRIHFARRGTTPWRDCLAKQLQETFCEVI